MNVAVFDDQTSELLQTGVLDYPEIAELERAVHRARAAFDSLPRLGACAVEALRDYNEKFRNLEALQEKARSAFAEKLDWRTTDNAFSLAQLRKAKAIGNTKVDPCDPFLGLADYFLGLADYFLDEGGKPVGIVGHTRRAWSECHEFATSQGLQVDAVPGSWYGPGVFIAVLYQKAP